MMNPNYVSMALIYSAFKDMYDFEDFKKYDPKYSLANFKNFCMSNKARVKRIKNRRRK